MASTGVVLSLVLLASVAIGAFANDPDMLQDVCVADLPSGKLIYLSLEC